MVLRFFHGRLRVLPAILALSFLVTIGAMGARSGSASSVVTVYSEALTPGWQNWSWDSDVNFAIANPVAVGTHAIGWTVTRPWGGLYLHTAFATDTHALGTLNFALRASVPGQQVAVALKDNHDQPLGRALMLTSFGGTPPAGAWQWYSVPVSALAPKGGSVGGVVIQDETGRPQPPMYVDEIGLTGATGLAAPPTSTVIAPPIGKSPPPTSATPQPLLTPSPTVTPRATATPPAKVLPSSSATPPSKVPPTSSATPPATATPPAATPPTATPPGATPTAVTGSTYPWHTNIVSTTFWVGEIFDASLPDGSQVFSTYDSQWEAHYGGCDGATSSGSCQTEARVASRNFFPSSMTPRENPFYLDLPFDDVNDPTGFSTRDSVIPWANQQPYAAHRGDSNFSYLKNRWVEIVGPNGHACYAQNEDAGPSSGSLYHDATYVFGTGDARPANKQFNGAGLDVSPALNGCLGYADLNGDNDRVSWHFVDAKDVPAGPWTMVITTTPYTP